MDQNDYDYSEKEMNPKQRRTFLDVVDGRLGELVVQHGGAGVEVKREQRDDGERRDEKEDGAAAAFDEEELRGVGAAVAGDFAAGGVPDGEELAGDRGGSRHSAVVAAKLHQEEYQEAAQGADRRYVEQVVDVAIPGAERVAVVAGGRRRRREGIFHGGTPKVRCRRRTQKLRVLYNRNLAIF